MTRALRARVWRIPLLALAVVGLLVAWAWPQELPWLRAAGIVTGWAGSGLLLASLLLMLREPWLAARLGGLEHMYRWHHLLGVLAYLLLLVHPLALAAAVWAESPALAWATLAPWQQGWPVVSGWIALLGLMLGLQAALWPRLPYARWRLLHHLLSLGVVAGAAHLVALGLHGVMLAVPLLVLGLLAWRLLRADRGLGARPYVVREARPLSADTVEVLLRPLAEPLAAAPGQFVQAAFLDGARFHGCGEFHPYTVSGITAGGDLSLGIKALGDCTRHLQAVPVGCSVRVQGPFGHFLGTGEGPAFWLAGGIGITPFVAALRARPLTRPVRLLYLHRGGDPAPYADELAAFAAAQPLLHLQMVATGDALPDLAALLPDASLLRTLDCHLCGPPGLLDAAVALLRQCGVAPAHIHFERFDFR